MPFDGVDDLKQSALFKRMRTLQEMSSQKLAAFVRVFNRVFERLKRGGVSDDEAESRTIPIALTAARSATFVPAGREAEERVHIFALMAEDMLHSGAGSAEPLLENVSANLSFPDVETMNDLMAGNTFNFRHNRDMPMGIIRHVTTPEGIPEPNRSKIDPAIRVVALASFFKDVPADERFTTVSPEWTELKAGDVTLALPTSFAITPTPAQDESFGIGLIADRLDANAESIDASHLRKTENAYEPDSPLPPTGTTMPDAKVTIESLQAEMTSIKEKFAEADERAAKAEKALGDFKARLANGLGIETKKPEDFNAEKAVSDLKAVVAEATSRAEKAEKVAAEIKAAALQAEAERWAEALVNDGKVPTEAAEKWASRYIKDAEATKELAATLPKTHVGVNAGKAAQSVPELDEAEAKQAMDLIYESLGSPRKEVA